MSLGSALLGAAVLLTAPAPASATAVGAASSMATATTAYRPSEADRRMSTMLARRATPTRFGTAFSGTVIDVSSNTVLWSKAGGTPRMPASTVKLVTAANALTALGPGRRFTTSVTAGSTRDRVVLVGAGDPGLSSAHLNAMARTVAATMKARRVTSVRVYADDRRFPAPTLAYGWRSSYVPGAITPVRSLVRDQRALWDTSADAARYLRDRIRAHGVAAGYYGRGSAPTGAAVLARSSGPTVATSVSRMLLVSDNEVAEALHKQVGLALGKGATWTGAAAAQRTQMSRQGLAMTRLYDGSGLSRADGLTSLQLARVVDRGLDPAYRSTLWPMQSAQAMPTAGRTGTLRSSSGRFTSVESRCAAGRVWAKTGTLRDVVALAGFTQGRDGRVKAFAFLVNGRSSTLALKQSVDMLAATVNGCR